MNEDELQSFPIYYQQYSWDGKHKLFGYPADSHPNYSWISSLEGRFTWLRKNARTENTAAIYLLREMIEWGGSQNGVFQKFADRSGEVNLYELVLQLINNIDHPLCQASCRL